MYRQDKILDGTVKLVRTNLRNTSGNENTLRDTLHEQLQQFIPKSILFSSFFTFLVSKYFISIRWLSFIILIIPVSQLVRGLINFLFSKLHFCILPRLDYTNGLTVDASTMLTIFGTISCRDDINELLKRVEECYLVNKSDNLYLSLFVENISSDIQTK